MQQVSRLSAILEHLTRNGSVAVDELAHELEVSQATVRRDLQQLEGQKLIRRTHGGAVARSVHYELPLRYRSVQHAEEKQRIAAAAAARVVDGAAIGLTGGTTTTEVARALVDRIELTVVTNALNIASELAMRPALRLVITGGVVRPESYELVGPLAEASLDGLNLDTVFLSADGVAHDTGLTTHHELEASTDRALISRARNVIVVADSSKLGRSAFARICALDGVHELITDTGADPHRVAELQEHGLTVSLV
jgi:DeoR family transcriptional regulator, aga operon transcriptional repressor